MKKTGILIALMLALLLLFAACAPAESTPDANASGGGAPDANASAGNEAEDTSAGEFDPSSMELGFNVWNKNVPVVQIMEAGFLDRGRELGYQATLYASEQANVGDTVAFGEQAIANGVDGLIVYLVDEGIKPLIKRAADAGIPVVTGHTAIENPEDWPGVVAWVACDATQYARDSAEAIAQQVGGKGTVAVTLGSFNMLENQTYEAFKEYMNENYPEIKILDAQEEGFDPAGAVTKATAIIQGNQDLVGAFSTTGGGAVAWSQAMEQTGKRDICVIGMDYSEQNLDLVRDGKVYAVVAQPLFEEHAYCVDLLDKILRGEEVPFDNLMDAPLITKDNVDEYYGKLEIVKEAFGK